VTVPTTAPATCHDPAPAAPTWGARTVAHCRERRRPRAPRSWPLSRPVSGPTTGVSRSARGSMPGSRNWPNAGYRSRRWPTTEDTPATYGSRFSGICASATCAAHISSGSSSTWPRRSKGSGRRAM